ncbi:MAG: SMP-30/gluconolactonase/LRE family protein [Chloroflexi bacterium]|nr:SMP-30/gluconolactonase/LRE family protein [Chloroflexota bacterium]
MPPADLDVHDQRLRELFADDAELETISTGHRFLEGPAWHPYEEHLRFSDILGNATLQWSEADGLSVYRANSHMANGNTYDQQGRLLSCHHGSSRVTRMDDAETMIVLASHFQANELNSPNDIVVKSDGAIYFTDPPYGREGKVGIPRERELNYCGVYRLAPADLALTLLSTDFNRPNGLCFSLDESLLYINDTPEQTIHVYNVNEDGTLAKGRLFAKTGGDGPGGPDGMKIDCQGNIYCCAGGGLQVFAADGTQLGRLRTPMQITNVAFGDADLRGIYLTGITTLYRVRALVPGIPLF